MTRGATSICELGLEDNAQPLKLTTGTGEQTMNGLQASIISHMKRLALVGPLLVIATATPLRGQSADDIARALQDPLANIKMINTDNTISFNTGQPDSVTGYNFQIQPVYAFSFEKFNFIPRAVIPIVGVPGGAYFPSLGDQNPPGQGVTWGLSDIIVQTFFNIKSDSDWKLGFGPQFSLKTHTDSLLAGPGWGLGFGVIVVGGFGDLSTTLLASQHWGDDGNFSVLTLQPMVFYNLPGAATVHYNNAVTYNSKAVEGQEWSVPLGLGLSKTFMLASSGHALDLALGAYYMVVRPDGGANAQLKVGISWVIP